MATRSAFTDEEWQTLQWAVSDTVTYLSLAEPGVWDTFKEASGASKFVAHAKTSSESLLVRDLAEDVRMKRDKEAFANPSDIAGEVAERIGEAARIVAEKAPEDRDAFREFILGLAKATAEAAKGIGPNEAGAIEKLDTALG